MGTSVESRARQFPQSLRAPAPAATEIPFPRCIHQIFEDQAARTPDAVAVIFEDRQLTYGELNSRANQLARHLQQQGVRADTIVALRVERSLEMIIGILGILKAGGAYLPLDPSYPAARQKFMLEDAGVRLLLTQSHLPALERDAETFRLDADWEKVTRLPVENPAPAARLENLAYVIYTSGSTGNPKGVLATHRNLAHSTEARFRYYSQPARNFLLLSSHAFDSSVAGIFWTLGQGGTLTLPHEYSRQTACELVDLIARYRVSHVLCLPSLYVVLLEQSAALNSLRTVIVAGETCPAGLVKRHFELLPRAELHNEYGPTEAAVWSTVYRCERRDYPGGVPIGRPIPGAQVHVLDEQLRPVPDGVPGELCIGGPGIARGYLNQPELTAARFIQDPFSAEPAARLYRTGDLGCRMPDGNIFFVGRLDQQVKLRGHRIEPEEIESAIRRHEAVGDVVVVVREIGRPAPVNGEAGAWLHERLAELSPADADSLLAEIEREPREWGQEPRPDPGAGPNGRREQQERRFPGFEVSLRTEQDFIRPPRESQRSWLLNRALDEFADDLLRLDLLSRRFVPGAESSLETFTADRSQAALDEQDILEDWHIPLMQAMARAVTETHGDVLEIGFGRGIASTFIQECGVRSHTIIECNDSVIQRFFDPWRKRFAGRNITLARGKWQDVIGQLGRFDGIFFQTYPLNEREFAEYLSQSITFAEHFFPVAAAHLNPGGAFTYLTHEIDSLSRRHQRLIFEHFHSVALSVQRLRLPADCRDLWWADSMVVVKAVK